jgi:hypothetical protein
MNNSTILDKPHPEAFLQSSQQSPNCFFRMADIDGTRQSPLVTLFPVFLVSAFVSHAQVNVLTGHNDNARTGLNPNETILTTTNVNIYGFGKIFSRPLDGSVYAQPLYVSNLPIPAKGTHNVVIVATMHDSVYAFDADSNLGSNAPPLWKASFINPALGTNVPLAATDVAPGQDCRTFLDEVGICGTPAIDLASGTLYVVARTKEPVVQVHRLHALDITTGNEKSNSPVVIDAVVPGTGAGSSGGFVHFNQVREMQRSALLLSGGVVHIAWASYCDIAPFHGWITSYDAQSLQQVGVYNCTPNGSSGGFWMGGAGLAAAPDGSIFGVTGNGTFDTGPNPQNFGDSFVKLTQGTNLALADYFTPFDQSTMDIQDNDLGAGGAIVLPDSVGSLAHPHLLVGAGKLGKIYLVDRDNMGHFNAGNDNQIVQSFNFFSSQPGPPHFFGLPAFFNNRLYVQGVGESLKAYTFTNGQLNTTPISQSAEQLGFRGATPSVSANGTNNGIVWQLIPTPPSLRAYDANNLSTRLYDSYVNFQAGLPEQFTLVKFNVPTVAHGKVFLGTLESLAVFGLRTYFWSASRGPAPGSTKLTFSGPTGSTIVLQTSSNLVQWADLATFNNLPTGKITYTDSPPPTESTRFYRFR